MKTLKFRAWTHQNPPMQWFSKNVAITGDGKQMTPIGGTYTGIWQALGDNDEGLTIEQYTGLKDKNGKEIYEGDIIRCILGDKPVEFHDGRYWLGETLDDLFVANLRYDLEVVGNIHTNPELLEVKNDSSSN